MRLRLGAGGPHERLETTRRRKDGSDVEVLITASTATDEAGRVMGLSVIAHDITERRAEQLALEASELRLAEAQRIAHLGNFEVDLRSNEVDLVGRSTTGSSGSTRPGTDRRIGRLDGPS